MAVLQSPDDCSLANSRLFKSIAIVLLATPSQLMRSMVESSEGTMMDPATAHNTATQLPMTI